MSKSKLPDNQKIINDYLEKKFSHSKPYYATTKCSLYHFLSEYKKSLFDFQKRDLMDYQEKLNNDTTLSLSAKKTKFYRVKKFLKWFLNYYEDQFDPLEQMKFIIWLNERQSFTWKSEQYHKESQQNGYKKLVMTKEEVQEVLLHLKYNGTDVKYLMFRTLAETGMRKGELRNINLEFQENGNLVPIEEDLKKRMIRTIGKKGKKAYYISNELSSLLLEYASERRKKQAIIRTFFISQKNHKFAAAGINQFLERVCNKINLEKHITPQTFRRTLNTLRKDMGCSTENRMILLNHKLNNVNLEHYTIYRREEFIKLYDQYYPFAKTEI